MKPQRKFKFFEAPTEETLVEKINQWIDETGARVVNYTALSKDSKPKMLLFYEADDEED